LLKHYSAYFRRALKKEWAEGQSKTVTLAAEDPKVFQAFFNWIMIGRLFGQLDSEGEIPLSHRLICRIYVFGDARGVPELCNAAVDLCFQKCIQGWDYPVHSLSYVYDNTVEDSKLRKFLVRYGMENFDFETLRDDEHCYPKDFLIDLVEELRVQDRTLRHLRTVSAGEYTYSKVSEICSQYHDHFF
jgi:hypothetical protein